MVTEVKRDNQLTVGAPMEEVKRDRQLAVGASMEEMQAASAIVSGSEILVLGFVEAIHLDQLRHQRNHRQC